jgi:hypothetical protein
MSQLQHRLPSHDSHGCAMRVLIFVVCLLFNAPAWPQQSEFYADLAGSNGGSCTQDAPCQTINYAVRQALNACVGGYRVVVNLGAGVWNETVNLVHAVPGCANKIGDEEPLLIQGAGSAQTTWNGCSTCTGTVVATGTGTDVALAKMTLMSTGAPGQNTLYAQKGALIQVIDDVVFGQSNNQQVHCENVGSMIQLWQDYTIASGSWNGNHVGATTQCGVYIGPLRVTLAPNLIFGGPFLFAQIGAVINLTAEWRGGPVKARKYETDTLSMIVTNGGGCTKIPGNARGIKHNGGLCF